jgi:PAS domain S-box-containing protein
MLLDLDDSFQIDHACCVDDGLRKLATGSYDVVVSDYEMPQKDGLQFLKELREQNNEIPFILFTGKGREEVAIQALNLGADGYFNKQGTPETVYGELFHGIRQSVERKKAKDALKVSEENFRAYLESSPISIFVANQEGKYEYVNEAASRLLAYSREELLNMTVQQVGPKQKTPKPRFIQLKEKGYFAEEMKLEQKNGKTIDVFLSSTKLPDGKLIAFCEDISERKVAEEKLKGTNAILDRIGESIDGGLAVISKDYHVIWANKRLMDLGVAPNKKCFQTFNTSKTICSDCGVKKIFEQKIPLDVHEFKTVNSKGETIWIELRVTPLKDKNGNVTAALELAVPITERKKADQKIREEAVLRNTLLDNIPCTALVLEKKTRKIVVANKIARESGAVPGEICYEKCANRAAPCTFCLAPQFWATNETQTLEVEYEGKYYRGIWLPYNEDLYVHYIFDITDAKKAQEKQEDSKKKYQHIFESCLDGMIAGKIDGTIISANPAMCKMLGMNEQEVIAAGREGIMVKDKRLEVALRERDESGKIRGQLAFKRKDNSVFEAELSSQIFEDPDGTKGVVVTVRDLTNSLMLEDKLRTIGSFTRHDVRNKLLSARGHVFLSRKLTQDKPEIKKHIVQIEAALNSISRILDVSKEYELIGSKKLGLVDVGKAFDEAVLLFTDLKGIRAINKVGAHKVLADPMLSTLFYNLIDNSIKYGEKATRIEVCMQRNKDGSESIVYKDNGMGISSEDKSRIFEKGFGKGSGYGLFLIKKTCEIYGWTISEVGEPGKGAKFVISIPKNLASIPQKN